MEAEQSSRSLFIQRRALRNLENPRLIPDLTQEEYNYAEALCKVDEIMDTDGNIIYTYHFSSLDKVAEFLEVESYNSSIYWGIKKDDKEAMLIKARKIQKGIVTKLEVAGEHPSYKLPKMEEFFDWLRRSHVYSNEISDHDIIKIISREKDIYEVISQNVKLDDPGVQDISLVKVRLATAE